jgi:hypothetical protein
VRTFRAHLIKFGSFIPTKFTSPYIVRTQNHSIPSHIKLKIEVCGIGNALSAAVRFRVYGLKLKIEVFGICKP